MKAESGLTAARIRDLLEYCPDTGVFTWKHEKRTGFNNSALMHAAGGIAGTPRKADGRIVIRLEGKTYLGYRLAWAWMTGRWPLEEIDHIDGDSTNDRFVNLREAGRRKNQENIRKAQACKKSSSFLGVYANKKGRTKPWRAAITHDGRQKCLGYFMTEAEAHTAYIAEKRILHEGCTI